MSIGIIIDEPKNEKEQLFFIPVATEEVFSSYWLKASNELQLSWIPIFETGILIEKEDIPAILRELGLVKEWIEKKCYRYRYKNRFRKKNKLYFRNIAESL